MGIVNWRLRLRFNRYLQICKVCDRRTPLDICSVPALDVHVSCKSRAKPMDIDVADSWGNTEVEGANLVCCTPSPCTSPHYSSAVKSSEASKQCSTGSAVTAPPLASPSNVAPLPEGTAVETDGLTQQPSFNGLTGIVQAWDPLMRRYDVLLDTPAGRRHVKLKRGNLRLRPPPPPSSTVIALASCIPYCGEAGSCHSEHRHLTSAPGVPSNSHDETTEWLDWYPYEPGMSPYSWQGTDTAEDSANTAPSAENLQNPLAPWEETFLPSSISSEFAGESPSYHALDNAGSLQHSWLGHEFQYDASLPR
jgi:hypothetical protein